MEKLLDYLANNKKAILGILGGLALLAIPVFLVILDGNPRPTILPSRNVTFDYNDTSDCINLIYENDYLKKQVQYWKNELFLRQDDIEALALKQQGYVEQYGDMQARVNEANRKEQETYQLYHHIKTQYDALKSQSESWGGDYASLDNQLKECSTQLGAMTERYHDIVKQYEELLELCEEGQ